MIDPYLDRIREFHQALYAGKQCLLTDRCAVLARLRLMLEELSEAGCAMHQVNVVETADALTDLLYVVFGTAEMFKIPIRECFIEVHRSNMTKDFVTTDTGSKGAKKGLNYSPPELVTILRRAGLL